MNPIDYILTKISTKKKGYSRDYPKTVAEVLDDNIKFRPSVDKAMIKFKKSNPWTGNVKEKILTLNKELASIYKIDEPQVIFVDKFAYGCCYFPIGNLIILEKERDGRYSIITFLHEFGHSLGKGERSTCKWSINLFRKHFPHSYNKLIPKGHLLFLKDAENDERTNQNSKSPAGSTTQEKTN